MALYGNAERVEAFGRRVLSESLLGGRSFLTEDALWTSEVFAELQARYRNPPKEDVGSFDEKVQYQLRDASSRAWQLFAELYIVDVAVLGNVGAEAKIGKINALLQRCDPPLALRGEGAPKGAKQVVDMFEHGGVLNGGLGFNAYRWRQLRYLIDFGVAWCGLDDADKARRLEDPMVMADTLQTLAGDPESQVMQALCYMLAPDSFVPISSKKHLVQLVGHFADRIPADLASAPAQMQSRAILRSIQQERGSDWDFYLDPDEWTNSKSVPGLTAADDAEEPPEDRLEETLPRFDDDFAASLLVDRCWLERLRQLLLRRNQVVFQGPPGTGKTYMARRIGARLAGAQDRVRLVQFHPAYTYEDFFEGFRPAHDGTLRLVSGPLRVLADEAVANPELVYFLIIDELNRGNLARIFGELYFLLEYREEKVDLMYSQEPFTLPRNLFIIATMNSADRSIALVDSAMRRRFAFLDLEPTTAPTNDLLRRWCRKNHICEHLHEVWQQLNDRIRQRDPQAQIGPSYLMRDELVEAPELVEEIWASEILPQLHESFYGNSEWVENNLSLAAIEGALSRSQHDRAAAEARGADVEVEEV